MLNVTQGFRLSQQQKRLWLLQDGRATYRTQCVLLLEGALDVDLLKAAVQHIVDRHEILRTTFQLVPGLNVPFQVISASNIPTWHEIDLRPYSPEEQLNHLEGLLGDDRQQPCDLADGPLMHLYLLLLARDRHMLFVSLPALVADTVTLTNVVAEIRQAYAAHLQGEQLFNEPLQYADFAEWQYELLEARDEDAQVAFAYWANHNPANVATLVLPFERTARTQAGFAPRVRTVGIDPALTARIDALAQQYGTSTPVILLACWQALFVRLTAQPNMVVGVIGDGRGQKELEHALGLFARYLPIRTYIEASTPFRDALKHVEQVLQKALEYQEYCIWGGWSDGDTLTFPSVGFEFEQWVAKQMMGEVTVSAYEQQVFIDRFKVKLTCRRSDDLVTAAVHYDSALFSDDSIDNLAEQYRILLAGAISNPEAAIGELSSLSENTRDRLLFDLNRTQTIYPNVQCVHQFFEDQVARTPNNVAIVFEDQQLTYAELNMRANQLAHYLRYLGVGSEICVGLCMERSLDLIVGLLGILKAGGAYVPLDPHQPPKRLASILEDIQAPILLSHQVVAVKLPTHSARVICLDTDWEHIDQNPCHNLPNPGTSDNLVYVLFTSGSAGRPKGVLVAHRQLVNYLNSIIEKLKLPPGAHFATVSTITADLGNTVIFSSLCTGACLHIVSQDRASSAEALADYFHQNPIDCLKIVPSHLSALLEASRPEYILPRQQLILGGETLHWDLIAKVQQLAPDCRILNHYGPTETTIGATTYALAMSDVEHCSATVPIGHPIANTQTYVLDERLKPVPIGMIGELYISGAGLARGYLGNPELTAEKFIPHPFSDKHGLRMYRTGDRARYLPNGAIEFLGRADDQVKFHGHRVELNEIRLVLRQHAQIHDAVVKILKDKNNNDVMVAYYISRQALDGAQLRSFLADMIPEEILPNIFFHLKKIPLTLNGKVNHQALPTLDEVRTQVKRTFTSPRTPIEQELVRIWAQVLGIEQVSVDDNFFALGGDSILGIQIIARANQIGIKLTPKHIFEHQTIAKLAAVAGVPSVLGAEQGLITGSVPLTPLQHWFFEQQLLNPQNWNQGAFFETRSSLDPKLLEAAVQQLLIHHDALRTRFQQEETSWKQYILELEPHPIFTYIDLSALPEQDQQAIIEETRAKLQSSLSLRDGPLLQVALFRIGAPRRDCLLIACHYLVVDAFSWRILLDDLNTLYQQLSCGEPMRLPAKTTSFPAWAHALSEYAQSESLHQKLDYWLVERDRHAAEFPIDFPAGANTEESVRSLIVSLGSEETEVLWREIPQLYRTEIDDVLVMALAQTLMSWTGRPTLVLDLENHGRVGPLADLNVSRTVGRMTYRFPLFLDMSAATNVSAALKVVKEQIRQVPGNGVHYGILRYLSQDAEIRMNLQALPRAQIYFNNLGKMDQVFLGSSILDPAVRIMASNTGLQGMRCYLFNVTVMVLGGQLKLIWSYSANLYASSTIERLAQHFTQVLQSFIRQSQSHTSVAYTPSDFPLSNLDQRTLDRVIQKLAQSTGDISE